MALRILVVARWYPSHDVPGRGIFVADQVAALVAAGAQVAVLCPDPVYVEGLEGSDRGARLAAVGRWAVEIGSRLAFAAPAGRGAAGVPVLRIPGLLPAGGQASRDPLELAALEAAVLVPIGRALHAAWPFDVIHAHTGMPDGLAAAQLADAVGVPLLTTEHDSSTPDRLSDPAAAEAYRGLLGPGRGLVTVSRALASRIEEQVGLEPGRISVVPNVLTLESFPVADDGARQPGELLWVGARKESKGTDTLLEAFAIVHAERPATRLRMIGRAATDTEDRRLRAIATGLGIANAVAFEPATERAAVAAMMARAALFVHPSPWETFGIVAAEALAMGLPVVATPSGGVEEILGSDGELGVIAASHDPHDLASAILATLDRLVDFDPAVLRAAVVERFAPATVAHELLRVMEELGAAESVDPGAAPPAVRPRAWNGGPVVVVGFRRSSALARIAAAPKSLVDRLTLVTTAAIKPSTGQPTGEAKAPIGVSGWSEADIGRAFRDRLAALGPVPRASALKWRTLLHPLRADARRRALAERSAMLAEARREAVADALARAAGTAPSARPMLVPLDADDLEPIESFLADGVADLAPGTFGWLIDRWETIADGRTDGARPPAEEPFPEEPLT